MTADNTEKLIEVRDWIRKELDTCCLLYTSRCV